MPVVVGLMLLPLVGGLAVVAIGMVLEFLIFYVLPIGIGLGLLWLIGRMIYVAIREEKSKPRPPITISAQPVTRDAYARRRIAILQSIKKRTGQLSPAEQKELLALEGEIGP